MYSQLQHLWYLVLLPLSFSTLLGAQEVEESAVENSLGMRFQRVADDAPLFSIWETRVQDYRVFSDATDRKWDPPAFEQSETHPVVKTSWGDTVAFCRWLTLREQEAGQLPAGVRYRLPTSAEWDQAAGVSPVTPENMHREDLMNVEYPWGKEWPPPQDAGNYHQDLRVDLYEHTSPVGSFSKSKTGLYDLGGNVWEWCMDSYNNALDFRVLRGASWRMRTPSDLQTGFRVGNVMNLRLDTYGFRIVLDIPAELVDETLEMMVKEPVEIEAEILADPVDETPEELETPPVEIEAEILTDPVDETPEELETPPVEIEAEILTDPVDETPELMENLSVEIELEEFPPL